MMGEELVDEEGTEGGVPGIRLPGMGLLPCRTSFQEEKTRTRVEGQFCRLSGVFACLSEQRLEGYEIHMGETEPIGGKAGAESALSQVREYQKTKEEGREKADGYGAENLYGSYLHGIFDAPGIAERMIRALYAKKGLGDWSHRRTLSYRDYQEQQYEKLAAALREHLDMEAIYRMLGLPGRRTGGEYR